MNRDAKRLENYILRYGKLLIEAVCGVKSTRGDLLIKLMAQNLHFYVLYNHRVMYCKWHTIKDVITAVNIMVDSGVGWIKSNKATNRKPLETLNCNAKPKRFQLTCHSPRSWSPVRCSWSCCGGRASAGFWCVWWNPSVCGSGSPG